MWDWMLAAFGVDDPGIVPGCPFVTSRYNLDLGLDVGCLWGGRSWDCPRMSLCDIPVQLGLRIGCWLPLG